MCHLAKPARTPPPPLCVPVCCLMRLAMVKHHQVKLFDGKCRRIASNHILNLLCRHHQQVPLFYAGLPLGILSQISYTGLPSQFKSLCDKLRVLTNFFYLFTKQPFDNDKVKQNKRTKQNKTKFHLTSTCS